MRNLLGITRKREMDQAEYDALVSAQEHFLDTTTAKTRFTDHTIRRMHRQWLGGIYPWAGRYRTVELAKDGFRWPPARLVDHNMRAFSDRTLKRYTPCLCQTDDPEAHLLDVAKQLAIVHVELLLIHPFRDGNGRLARWLTDLMALQAGLPVPNYGLSGRGSVRRRRTYLEGVKQGYLTEHCVLADFFADALQRALVTLN